MERQTVIRTKFCTLCGVCFNHKVAESNSLYDHSRPELCFGCQRSVIPQRVSGHADVVSQPFITQEPDKLVNPWNLSERFLTTKCEVKE